jgi:hypothetical protein
MFDIVGTDCTNDIDKNEFGTLLLNKYKLLTGFLFYTEPFSIELNDSRKRTRTRIFFFCKYMRVYKKNVQRIYCTKKTPKHSTT